MLGKGGGRRRKYRHGVFRGGVFLCRDGELVCMQLTPLVPLNVFWVERLRHAYWGTRMVCCVVLGSYPVCVLNLFGFVFCAFPSAVVESVRLVWCFRAGPGEAGRGRILQSVCVHCGIFFFCVYEAPFVKQVRALG